MICLKIKILFYSFQQQGSESDVSLAGDHRSSKRDLKDRLSGMFRRGQSSSRSNSTEVMSADAAQRPVAVTVSTISNGPGTPHLVKKSVSIFLLF